MLLIFFVFFGGAFFLTPLIRPLPMILRAKTQFSAFPQKILGKEKAIRRVPKKKTHELFNALHHDILNYKISYALRFLD